MNRMYTQVNRFLFPRQMPRWAARPYFWSSSSLFLSCKHNLNNSLLNNFICFFLWFRMKTMALFYRQSFGGTVMKIELDCWFSVQKPWKSLVDANLKRPVLLQNAFTDGSIQNEFENVIQYAIKLCQKRLLRINFSLFTLHESNIWLHFSKFKYTIQFHLYIIIQLHFIDSLRCFLINLIATSSAKKKPFI